MSEKETKTPKPRSRRKLVRRIAMIGVPVIVCGIGAYFYITGGRYVSTENAYVKVDMVAVSPQISGRVKAVPVSTNDRVRKDQILFRLDQAPFQIALQHAQAQLDSVGNELRALQAQYREKQGDLASAREDVTYYQKQFKRQSDLAKRKAVSQALYDEARHKLNQARQQVETLQQELGRLKAQLNGDPTGPVESHPRYHEALAQVEQAKLDLAHTVVRAPADGIAGKVKILAGDYVSEGEPAVSVVEDTHVWVEANLKETQLTHLAVGQEATLSVDAYPGRVWHARVTSVSPATGAEYSLLPPQNASGNWVKVVQRVPVRLHITDKSGPPLRAGMSVVVDIDTGWHRTLGGLFNSAVASTGQR